MFCIYIELNHITKQANIEQFLRLYDGKYAACIRVGSGCFGRLFVHHLFVYIFFFRFWIMTKTTFVLATFSKLRGFAKFLPDLGIELKLLKIAFAM